jgi:hypothetical protein
MASLIALSQSLPDLFGGFYGISKYEYTPKDKQVSFVNAKKSGNKANHNVYSFCLG